MPDPFRSTDFLRDNDALHVMPMRIVPLETAMLRRGRIVKNTALAPSIELFRGEQTGSGHIMIEDLDAAAGHKLFGWPPGETHNDLKMLRALGELPSYDVYSLRIHFRDLGIAVSSIDHLRLSPAKQQELVRYMRDFTLPLIDVVYGERSDAADRADNVIDLFRDPDVAVARRNLRRIADILGVPVSDIPRFLEDFSDVYLSLAYYQEHLDSLMPKISDLIGELDELGENWQLRQQPGIIETLTRVHGTLSDLTTSINGRFERFRRASEHMWDDLSAERFQRVKTMITASHATTGGVLCGLGVKVGAWKRRFPKRESGGPLARADMLFTDILPGMDSLLALERKGRRIAHAA